MAWHKLLLRHVFPPGLWILAAPPKLLSFLAALLITALGLSVYLEGNVFLNLQLYLTFSMVIQLKCTIQLKHSFIMPMIN